MALPANYDGAAAPCCFFCWRWRPAARREHGVAYGFKTPIGGGFGKTLDYEFDVGRLKDRVTGVITGSGWTYQPVLRAPKR